MDKVLERVLVEFLIPAFLMFLCMLVAVDVLSGTSFDLRDAGHRNATFGNPWLVTGVVLVAYVVNTSLSSMLNLLSRKLFWGRVREYLIYRKLNVFKQEEFEKGGQEVNATSTPITLEPVSKLLFRDFLASKLHAVCCERRTTHGYDPVDVAATPAAQQDRFQDGSATILR